MLVFLWQNSLSNMKLVIEKSSLATSSMNRNEWEEIEGLIFCRPGICRSATILQFLHSIQRVIVQRTSVMVKLRSRTSSGGEALRWVSFLESLSFRKFWFSGFLCKTHSQEKIIFCVRCRSDFGFGIDPRLSGYQLRCFLFRQQFSVESAGAM
jgi:hypothetical protein